MLFYFIPTSYINILGNSKNIETFLKTDLNFKRTQIFETTQKQILFIRILLLVLFQIHVLLIYELNVIQKV
jgi:hypothetical protein